MTTSNYPYVALRLSVLDDRLAVCRLEPGDEIPKWALKNGFFSITHTPDELSIVCLEQNIPNEAEFEGEWRALKVEGPLDFSLVGILASISGPLADAGISVFTISTYDTDYVLVNEDQLDSAIAALRDNGHEIAKT